MEEKVNNENMEIAEKHVELAEQILSEEAKKLKGKDLEKISKAEFALEKAEANIEELCGKKNKTKDSSK